MVKKIYKVNILKLDHRPERDKRITTHCALVSRAFGANEFIYSGIQDKKLEEGLVKIIAKWGGDFKINYLTNPLAFIKQFKNEKDTIIVHLTMYGEQVVKVIPHIKNTKNILFIVGGPKVPKAYYDIADYNASVTNQPHSEVAALAITLYLLNPKRLEEDIFEDAEIQVIPNKCGKNVINLK